MRMDGCTCYMTKQELIDVILLMPENTEFEVSEELSFTHRGMYLVASSNHYEESLNAQELSL